jgi:SP family general alpha glucoside:H+ symporter-like MFS transporter
VYIIPAYWQSLWNALAQAATIFRALFVASISDRFGRRTAFFLAGVVSFVGVAVVYVASSPGVFLTGKMIHGISLGMALATGQMFISGITPLRIRGVALSAFTFNMVRKLHIRHRYLG